MKRSLGVCVRNGTLTFVELGGLLGQFRVLRSGSLPAALPADTSAGGALDPWSALSKGSRPAAVVLGLPRRAVVLRILELPVADEKDLAGLITYELERHLPFPPEEAYYGFQRIADAGPQARVLLVAARKADVDAHIERLDRLGLRPTAVSVSSLGAANALRLAARAPAVCLVEHEEREAEVTVLRQGALVSSRAIVLQDDPVPALAAEIERALPREEAAEIQAAAGGGLRDALAQALGRPVKPWDRARGGTAASAYGLALAGLRSVPLRIDLLPSERKARAREPALRTMLGLLVLVAVLAAALLVSGAYRERQTLTRLRAEAAGVRANATQVDALRSELARLQGRLKAVDAMSEERTRALLVMKEVATLLPRDVVLTEFVVDGLKLQIRGSTGGSPAELIAAFEKSTVLENAAFTSPIAAQGKDRQGFQLQAFVRSR